jgi:AraC-like DNA-binding protein
MKIAAEMLKEKNKTISEVAYDSGFSDPAYFSKTFKNYFGVTPTEYINN